MNGQEIEVRTVPPIEKFRERLLEVTVAEDLPSMLALTDAAIAYAKVTKSIELMNDAVELRLWTERRAGEILRGGDPPEQAAELKTTTPMIKRWIFFASITDEEFEQSVKAIRDTRDLSVSGMFEHIVFWYGKTVTRGVRKLPDGRYRISWKTIDGQMRSKTVDGPYGHAKGHHDWMVESEKEKRIIRESKTFKRLDVAYSRVRRLLNELDAMLPTTSKSAKDSVEFAIAHLHKVEDALSEAMKGEETDALFEYRQQALQEMAAHMEGGVFGQ